MLGHTRNIRVGSSPPTRAARDARAQIVPPEQPVHPGAPVPERLRERLHRHPVFDEPCAALGDDATLGPCHVAEARLRPSSERARFDELLDVTDLVAARLPADSELRVPRHRRAADALERGAHSCSRAAQAPRDRIEGLPASRRRATSAGPATGFWLQRRYVTG